MRLKNKSAIVTAGAQGIGKAISLAFAREGHFDDAVVCFGLGTKSLIDNRRIDGAGGRDRPWKAASWSITRD